MDALTSAAGSGIRARLESLDMLANNIANASAPGFKADHEFYSLYLSADAADSPGGTSPPVLPVVERPWTDFSQGSLLSTGNSLDLALNGNGFFVASSPRGPLYTRSGSFRLSARGELQTKEGYALQDPDGRPVLLDSTQAVEVASDGTIRQGGQDISRLAVVDFNDRTNLSKHGDNYFQMIGSSALPMAATGSEIQQGKVEAANAQPAQSAVRLVSILRQFEALQKALAIGADMNRRSVEDVAKVSE